MRICLAVRALPSHRLGGLEFHSLDLANGLAARGHEVVIITSLLGNADQQSYRKGVEVVNLRAGPPGDYSAAFFQGIASECAKLHSANPFDLIHCQEFAGLFLRPPGCPMICTIHGTMFSEVPLNRRYFRRLSTSRKAAAIWRYKMRLVLAPFFRRMLNRANLVFTDSDYTRRELLRINSGLRKKIRMVPLGLDGSRYSIKSSHHSAPLSISLLGRLQEMKGLKIVAEAAALLRQRNVMVKFHIGGSGEYEAELRTLLLQQGLQDSVKMAGSIEPDQVSEFFSQSDLFLFPDLTQPAFGLVAVEAMLHGLPVIGARSGAIPEIVTSETGWIYNPWSSAELAAVIERVAGEPAVLKQKAHAAKARAVEFTAEKMAANAENHYVELLKRK